MTVETATDRLTMLADFGETVTFSPGVVWPNRADTAASITMIFDADYLELPGEQVRIDSNNPIALGRTADLAGAVRNSVISRESNGEHYKVVSVQDDGTGMTLLELEGPR